MSGNPTSSIEAGQNYSGTAHFVYTVATSLCSKLPLYKCRYLKTFFQSGIPYDQLFHSKDVHKPSGFIDDGQFTEVKGQINRKVVKGLVILEADRQYR